jgi:hypothetical protein
MFAVLEIQSGSQMAVLVSTYADMNSALSKFYQTMVSATQSAVPKHTVAIIDEVGMIVKKETVFHEVEA